jgi:hypothetical protein
MPVSYIERLRMDPSRQTVPAGQKSGHSVRLDNHFSSVKGPCRAPAWHFDSERRGRRGQPSSASAAGQSTSSPTPEASPSGPAGQKSGQHVRLDNHFSSSDGPCRAPSWHFDPARRHKNAPSSPLTDPIAFRYEEGSPPSPRQIRRIGYDAKSAMGTWSLSPRGGHCDDRVPLSPVVGSRDEEPKNRGASLRSRSEAHHYRGGNYFFYVAGEEDMQPAGTNKFVKCDLPPSSEYTRLMDQLENRVRSNHTFRESSDMQFVLGKNHEACGGALTPSRTPRCSLRSVSESPPVNSPMSSESGRVDRRRSSVRHIESTDMSFCMGVSVDPM